MLRIERAIQKKEDEKKYLGQGLVAKKRATHTIFKELYDEDPREYKAVMRVTPEQVETLLNLIAPKIQRDDTLMRDAIVKLEINLVYLSSGVSYRLLSVFFRVSKASIIKIIPEVCAAINESRKGYIKVSNFYYS
ncbi:hypothetical protein HF086_012276 [Spodoptera exigua]|uniref:Uncharacterized protein n=1 Tax=Spodoptera exigua TaxID=7107 RepID=A0A922MEW8_SPOEX|nr:hypothetical protein HF086_012276 [Spodoptera exigua]